MASVSSLDQDMRKLRADRYTPKAANEARAWIEDTLGEKLPGGDLIDALKDGTALCRYFVYYPLAEGTMLTSIQTCESMPSQRADQIQEVQYAFHTDGEHLSLSPSLRVPAAKYARPRPLPHC
jgi:hypothetical protein